GASHPLGTNNGFKDVAGTVTLTPASPSMNGGASLNVPYYLVPRARSLVSVSHNVPTPASPNATLTVSNGPASIAGTADFYAWGLSGTPQGLRYVDTRAVGVQTFPAGNDATLVFAINTFTRFSNASPNEWDILIDTNGDGVPDFLVVGFDVSGLVSGQPPGRFASGVINLATNAIIAVRFADAATDGTTILLAAKASELGLSPTSPRFSYVVNAFNGITGESESVPGRAKFNAFTPSISTGQFVTVQPNGTATVPVSINTAEWAITPALGVMAVAVENLNGAPQADTIPVSP
ncbi:MAG TPA: peptidase S8 and S53 subtilisin kexin sedolisin, partial [Casimicrobiaceae bacterium]|nr:peptidase S8 and S53 subtilisin kexin sedolisin [Casimicrobiaceae bacterium]